MHTPISQTLWNVKMLQFFGLSKAIFVVARQLSTIHGLNKRSIPSLAFRDSLFVFKNVFTQILSLSMVSTQERGMVHTH